MRSMRSMRGGIIFRNRGPSLKVHPMITASVSQEWPSMTLVDRLPGPHVAGEVCVSVRSRALEPNDYQNDNTDLKWYYDSSRQVLCFCAKKVTFPESKVFLKMWKVAVLHVTFKVFSKPRKLAKYMHYDAEAMLLALKWLGICNGFQRLLCTTLPLELRRSDSRLLRKLQ